MRRLLIGCAALVCLLVARPVLAQETRGSLSGVVKDSSGGVLPGVTVEATLQGGAPQVTVTDARGVYRFPALPPGTYVVKSTLSGFTQAKVEGLRVELGQLLTVDLAMAPAGLSESVDVKAELPAVDVKQNAVTQVLTSDVIDLIPKTSTGILGALQGLPGATNETRLGGFGIDGAGASENRYIIDGMDVSNLQTGVLGKDLINSFIDAVQIKQSGYNAEYRAATGGVVSVVTKSGTNKFHGDINEFISGRPLRGLQGEVRPSLRLVPTDNTKAEYFTTPRLNETTSSNPAYNIGGPVVRNKIWFFAGYNPQWSRQVRTVIWTIPAQYADQSATYESKSKDMTAVYNVTTQFAANKRIRFSGSNERTTGGLGLPGIDSTNGKSNSNATSFNPRPTTYAWTFNDAYSAVYDWTLSNTTYINVTGGYLSYTPGPNGHTVGGDYYHGTRRTFATTNVNLLDVPPNLQQISGYADNNSNSFNKQNDFSRITLNADMTKFFNWHGQHAVKVGGQLERFGNAIDNGQQNPNVALNWNRARTTLSQTSVRGTYGYYVVTRQYTIGNIHSNNIGFFAQDQWTPSSKLTINYGLRTDQTNIPSYREENKGIKFTFGQKMAPRLGFAYDIRGDGKWKGYGSWGVFYNIEQLDMPLGSFGAQHWIQYYYTLDNYNWPAIDCEGPQGSGCPGTFIEQVDLRHVSNGQGVDNLVDPNLNPYKSQELTFGLDHQLSRTITVGTRYTHKWISEAIEDVGTQVPNVGEVFYIANPGKGLGEFPQGPEFPATPRPKRHYDGIEFKFNRRLQDNWLFNASLLLSRTWGSYSGLTSSDENGRNSPGVNRYYDELYLSFDQTGKPVYGLLASDRPFQLKLQPAYILPWGTQVGAEIDVESGLLQSSTVTFTGVPVFVYGRNDLGRTPVFSYTNLNFQQSVNLPKRFRATIALNIENLFDQMTVTGRNTTPYQTALLFPGCTGGTSAANTLCANRAFFAGFDTKAIMAANGTTVTDPRYGKDSGFQGFRTARLQLKLSF